MTVQVQRPLRGSRISSFYPIKNLPSLASLDSAFQLQEYISLLIRLDVHDVDAIVTLPGKKDGEGERDKDKEKDTGRDKGKDLDGADDEKSTDEKDRKAGGEVTVDEACWIYEQLRYCTYLHSSQTVAHSNSGVSHRIYHIHLSQHCNKNAHAHPVPK
jgi:hypothetical protein